MSKHLCPCDECGDDYPFRALTHSDLFPGFLCNKCKELENKQIKNTDLEKELEQYEEPMSLDDADDSSSTTQ